MSETINRIKKKLAEMGSDAERIAWLNELREDLHRISPLAAMPVDLVRWIPVGDVQANDYNPNSVAPNEMRLLHTSISHDGYTQPIVAIFDDELGKYVIVDGFHRFTTCRVHSDIQTMTKGHVPVVVIEKSINDRMASTVRHNRARGKHSQDGMASMVFAMLEEGWDDAAICNEIGVTPEELGRLKHVTGFSKLFENAEYKQSWTTARMSKFKRDYEKGEALPETEEDDDRTINEA